MKMKSGSKLSDTFGVVDLFAGCGGLTQGFSSVTGVSARFTPIAAVEVDPDAAATYAVNFGAHVFANKIEDWLGCDIPRADVVIGGPPCQGFSSLGKRDPDDDRNKLWRYYAAAVAAVKPYYFVLENVTPFLRSDQFAELERAVEEGELTDYKLDLREIVRAKDYGAAQDRRRAVVVGRRKDMPAVDLNPWKLPPRTVRDAFSALEGVEPTGYYPPNRCTDVRLSEADTIEVEGPFTTRELHLNRHYELRSLRRFEAIPPGGNRFDLPWSLQAECWRQHKTGSVDVMGRLHWDKPSVTIRTEFWKPEKGRYLHPVEHRAITHAEAALLQGFPLDFKWCGSKLSIGRQIGNAVPVELGRAIATAILAAFDLAGVRPLVTQR